MGEYKTFMESLADFVSPPLDKKILDTAIFVENADYGLRVSHITITGKYNREYTIVAFAVKLNENRILIDRDFLIICLWSNILIIDLKTDKLIRNIDLDCWEMFSISKFKSGYVVHGEGEIRFINQDFDIVWKMGCCDIFSNSKVEKEFTVFDDYVVAYDWYGYKHYYNEGGEFKTEYYPEYNMEN